MSHNWDRYRAADLIRKGILAIGDGYRAKNSELSNSGLPFARAGNINNGFKFDGCDYFPQQMLSKVGDKISKPGDVVFTSKGTVGRFAFVKHNTPTFVFSPQLCYWRSLDHNQIDPRFLYCWMNSKEFLQQVNGVKGQTDMADYVSLSDQRQMYVTLPPIDDQKTIASLVGVLDDKIDLNLCMNETLESMARTIFQSWFVDYDPVRAKAEGRQPWGVDAATAALFPDLFESTKFGDTPVGWKVQGLDTVATFLNGLALQKYPANSDEFLPVIKIAELRQGVTANSGRASLNVPDKYVIKDGDVLFSWSGSLVQVLWAGGHGALNQHLFKVTSDKYPKWFHYFWVDYHLPDFQAIASAKATTMGHIQREHLSAALVVIPTVDILTEADKIISPLFEKMMQCRIESRILTSLRDKLLPKLVSGEIRLQEAEQKIEEAIA